MPPKVNFNFYELDSDILDFLKKEGPLPFVTSGDGPAELGQLAWSEDVETIVLKTANDVNLEFGEKLVFPVQNNTGSDILKGTPVAYAGTIGNSGKTRVKPWNGATDAPLTFMGIASSNITNGDTGHAIYFGKIRGINTQAYTQGAILYASPTGNGLTQTKPSDTHVIAALCITSANNGTLLIRPSIEYITHWDDVYSKPTEFPPEVHEHGNISNAGTIGTEDRQIITTGQDGVLEASTPAQARDIMEVPYSSGTGEGSSVLENNSNVASGESSAVTGGSNNTAGVSIEKVILISDNFNENNTSTNTFNSNLESTQSGILATVPYVTYGNNIFHGGTNNALHIQNGGGVGSVFFNRDFSVESISENKPIQLSFRIKTVAGFGDPTEWVMFNIANEAPRYITDSTVIIGSLFAQNGSTQFFSAASMISSSFTWSANDKFTWVLSDLAGTGSPHTGAGCLIKVFKNDSLIFTHTATGLTDNFLTTFAGPHFNPTSLGYGQFDDVEISLVNSLANYTVVSGGLNNKASSSYATISGGDSNTATGNYSAVVGGRQNTANGSRSFIGGGRLNEANGINSTISGGRSNKVSNYHSTVSGGSKNIASGSGSFIGGGTDLFDPGTSNRASGFCSNIVGGTNNAASADYTVIAGGKNNIANSNFSSVLGGEGNSTDGYSNAHIIGSNITADANNSTFVENLKIVGNGLTFPDGSTMSTAATGGGSNSNGFFLADYLTGFYKNFQRSSWNVGLLQMSSGDNLIFANINFPGNYDIYFTDSLTPTLIESSSVAVEKCFGIYGLSFGDTTSKYINQLFVKDSDVQSIHALMYPFGSYLLGDLSSSQAPGFTLKLAGELANLTQVTLQPNGLVDGNSYIERIDVTSLKTPGAATLWRLGDVDVTNYFDIQTDVDNLLLKLDELGASLQFITAPNITVTTIGEVAAAIDSLESRGCTFVFENYVTT